MNDQQPEPLPINQFDTDVGKVWYAGSHLLPKVADHYADMSRKVWMTRGADAAFQGQSVTGRLAAVYESWNELRTELQNILATTSTNVANAGGALVEFSNGISATDAAAAQDIADTAKELGNLEVTVDQPVPGGTPDPSTPTQIHEEGSHRPGETGL